MEQVLKASNEDEFEVKKYLSYFVRELKPHGVFKIDAEKFKENHKEYPLKEITSENDKSILKEYYNILDFLVGENKVSLKNKKSILKDLLPVLKDITRVNDFLNEILFNKDLHNLPINILPNTEKLHCEVNMIKHHKDEVGYIGLSKLSCFICELILKSRSQKDSYDYAGSHGLYFHYNAKGFVDKSMLLEFEKAVKIIISNHNDHCKNKGSEPLLLKESSDLIDDILKLDEQKFVELFGDKSDSKKVNQIANYCFWHPEHEENEVKGFHPENPQADLLGYTVALRESLGLTSADYCPDYLYDE